MIPRWANYLGFQLGWLACVGGAGRGLYWLGPVVCAVLLAAHAALRPSPTAELRRLAGVAALGLALELIALSFGCHRFAGPGPVPLWVAALWLLFAATLDSSLAWLADRPWLAALLGAAAGPLSFRAGVGLGAGAYAVAPAAAAVILAAQWAVAMPAAFAASRRIK
jgi:hypothetical protein